MAKLCTKIRADVVHAADGVHIVGNIEVIDVSVVRDDHEFGVDPDGFLHLEGSVSIETARETTEENDG
jgi:hypothetical protein